jgi:hypothetical protein
MNLLKYVEEITLLNPENATVLETDIANIRGWAKIMVSMVKTKEMIFCQPNPKLTVFLTNWIVLHD